MANAPTDSQLHPLLRQRMVNRAATSAEDTQPPPAPRRRSSLVSEYSGRRDSFLAATDDLFNPAADNDMEKLTRTDEVSLWYSAPLAFAIVPAFAGLLFTNGGAVVTDILLLAFGSVFLNWCVRTPWEWYHASQQMQYINYDEPERDDTILEEKEGGDGSEPGETKAPTPPKSKTSDDIDNALRTRAQDDARQELKNNEMLALFTCFIGPLFGAYILHAIRSQLTRPAEGLVSNYNLTIFVMGAELRPIHHMIKLKHARVLHLQRIVRSETHAEPRKADIQDISARLADLEARAESPQNTDIENQKIGASVRQGIQPQLDALNRAVRRYEKRQAAQSMQIEARFRELDNRVRDALALAAAAVRTGQRPGIVWILLMWIAKFFAYVMRTTWAVATYPYKTAAAIAVRAEDYVVGRERQPRKRMKAQANGNGYAAVSTHKMHSKS